MFNVYISRDVQHFNICNFIYRLGDVTGAHSTLLKKDGERIKGKGTVVALFGGQNLNQFLAALAETCPGFWIGGSTKSKDAGLGPR